MTEFETEPLNPVETTAQSLTRAMFPESEAQAGIAQVRELVAESGLLTDLPVMDVGAGDNLDILLVLTDAPWLILVDPWYVESKFDLGLDRSGITLMSNEVHGEMGRGGKRVIRFSLADGRERIVELYGEDATVFLPSILEEKPTAFLVMQHVTPRHEGMGNLNDAKAKARVLNTIAVNGFTQLRPMHVLPLELAGFREVQVGGLNQSVYKRVERKTNFSMLMEVDAILNELQLVKHINREDNFGLGEFIDEKVVETRVLMSQLLDEEQSLVELFLSELSAS